MGLLQNRKVQALFFVIFCVLFFAVKYYGPNVVETLYANGKTDILNRMTHSQGSHEIDYYLGRADDVLFGPVSSLISGLLLLAFCFLYLKNASAYVFAITIFVYLMLTRFEVLFYPPYGDSVTGIFFDVMWIARHSFDYIGLFYERKFSIGGPQTYPVCIFPSFLAFLMQITPSAKMFLVASHVFVFGCAAASVAIFRNILLKIFDMETAVIGAVTLVSLPIFQSMAEMINMEIPVLFFTIFSVYFLVQKKFLPAAILSALALLVKAPGGIAGIAILVGSVLIFVAEPNGKARVKGVLYGLAAAGFTVSMFLLRKAIVGQPIATNNITAPLIGWPGIKAMISFKIFFVLIGGLIYGGILWVRNHPKEPKKLSLFINEYFVVLMMFLMAGLWFLIYMNFAVIIDRYKVLLAPFFICCTIYVGTLFIRNKKIVKTVLVVLTGVFFLSSHGHFGQRSFASDYYSGHERSLEYRNTLKRDMKVAKYIEENFPDKMICAPFVLSYVLNFAEIGYVTKPFKVTLYGIMSHHEDQGVYDFRGLDYLDIMNTIWLGYPDYSIIEGLDYPVGKNDKIIKNFNVGNKQVVVFMGGFAIETIRRVVELSRRGELETFLKANGAR
jgi:hypothetical protein